MAQRLDRRAGMSEVLAQLEREHRDLERLLAVLERQVRGLARGEDADLGLMQSVLRYMANYPDLLHHPKEDLVYRRLVERDDGARTEVLDIVREHQTLDAMTHEFAILVEKSISSDAVEQDDLARLGRDYTELYRRHIATEDDALFPRAQAVLRETDWEEIDAAVSPRADPLFDGTVADQYRALFEEILRLGV